MNLYIYSGLYINNDREKDVNKNEKFDNKTLKRMTMLIIAFSHHDICNIM